MRARLVRATTAVALVAVVTLGLPLLVMARHEVYASTRDALRQQAVGIAAGIEDELDANRVVDLSRYANGHRRVVAVTPRGTRSDSGALRGPVVSGTARLGASVVTVSEPAGPTTRRVRVVTIVVVALSALAVAVAVGLALAIARRLSRPLAHLLDRAEALGRGGTGPELVESGIAEIDGVARVLERSAIQLATTLELQRDFAGDAAHQLRTPLTGIGLRLEELARTGDESARQEAELALGQVERLDRVITALLARARGDAAEPTLVDLQSLLRHEEPAWAAALAAQGRTLHMHTVSVAVHARQEHLGGVLSCLLDNALHHGGGAVHVTVAHTAGATTVEVRDEGPGVPSELASAVFDRRVSGGERTGIGLALARSLATAEGGRLELVDPASALFRLTLAGGPPAP